MLPSSQYLNTTYKEDNQDSTEYKVSENKQFEALKQHFILETLSFLTILEQMELKDVTETPTKAHIALLQAQSAEAFAELCKFIKSLPSVNYEEIVRAHRMAS